MFGAGQRRADDNATRPPAQGLGSLPWGVDAAFGDNIGCQRSHSGDQVEVGSWRDRPAGVAGQRRPHEIGACRQRLASLVDARAVGHGELAARFDGGDQFGDGRRAGPARGIEGDDIGSCIAQGRSKVGGGRDADRSIEPVLLDDPDDRRRGSGPHRLHIGQRFDAKGPGAASHRRKRKPDNAMCIIHRSVWNGLAGNDEPVVQII